ncbi:MAG: molybdopterin biosynthesis protein [Promethearchaeota archaeon]
MTRKVYLDLISIEEAKRRFYEHFKIAHHLTTVSLWEAGGRVLAEDIIAGCDVPPFDRARMDGYALIASDSFEAEEDNPIALKIIGEIPAGVVPDVEVNSGECAVISTGAVIPKGANSVIMVEYTEQEENHVKLFRSVVPGEHIMFAGSDVKIGEIVLRNGVRLSPREIGIIAALGITEVPVYQQPDVAIISTGDEIILPGESLESGKIFDINGATLVNAVRDCGCKPHFLGIIRDSPEVLKEKLNQALSMADVVLLSGGTSKGVGDLSYSVINELGKPGILVHGVAIKPGKPLLLAVINNKPVIGLPGYPTSALTVFEVFVAPFLRTLAGIGHLEKKTLEAYMVTRVDHALGRHEFLPVHIIRKDSVYFAYPVLTGSGAITTLGFSDGFVEIPSNQLYIDENERVTVELFSNAIEPADLVFIGSHCLGVDLIYSLMQKQAPNLSIKLINVGSMGGINSIRRGEADIAGIHLFDAKSNEYNLPFIQDILDQIVILRGYKREQGLIVEKGNPKNITGLRDLLREDISFINRQKGSGTRILIDYELEKIAQQEHMTFSELIRGIAGYEVEAKTHSAIASSIAYKKADIGVAIYPVAVKYGLDFLPLREEFYDFIIPNDRLDKESVQLFIETLRSKEFKEQLSVIHPGLQTTEETGSFLNDL